MAQEKPMQYVVMPPRGVRDNMMLNPILRPAPESKALPAMMMAMSANGPQKKVTSRIRVIDSIHEDGLKLVEMPEEAVRALRRAMPGVRLVPLVYYHRAEQPRARVEKAAKQAAGVTSLQIVLRSKADAKPIAGAHVVAFTDFANRIGAEGDSNAQGKVTLKLGGLKANLDALYVYPPHGFWGRYARNLKVSSGDVLTMSPIDLAVPDFAAALYPGTPLTAGNGVTVGVVDSGIALNHPDLVVAGGMNTVTGEQPIDFGPAGDHGSHVAGIIAARGTVPTGVRGIAPGVTLRSYRVFGESAEGASNFDIAKAVDQATADGCDLLNLSLGGGSPEATLAEAINDAFQRGVLSVCAAGNNGRLAVSFPAQLQQALAVSALGEKGTFPADAVAAGDIEKPFATSNAKRFIAAFSNVGTEIDLTGPGVGIVSTVPDRAYAVMSGTSMACPAVTGRIAAMMSQRPDLLASARDDKRTRAIMKLAFDSAKLQGFGTNDAHFEGQGLI